MSIFDFLKQRKQPETEKFALYRETPEIRESFITLRSSLSVWLAEREEKSASVLCVSSRAHDGKTPTAINLAASFADERKKVVFVDADLRAGNATKHLDLQGKLGLCDVLLGKATLDEALVEVKELGCFVLPCGAKTELPYELLASSEMDQLAKELKERFEIAIYDVAPLRACSDGYALASKMDGVAFVSKHYRARENEIQKSLATLRYHKANVLGLIVSDYKKNRREKKLG